MRFILIFIFSILIVENLSAEYLNDVSKGSFVDIGKLSGFDEIETPKLNIKEEPNYSLVSNIINRKNRLLDLDRCFEDNNSVSSCLKDEVQCDYHEQFGTNIITPHSATVVDYMDADLKNRINKEVYNNYEIRHNQLRDGTAKCINGTLYWETNHSAWHTTSNYRGGYSDWYDAGSINRINTCNYYGGNTNTCKIDGRADNHIFIRIAAASCYKMDDVCPGGYTDNGTNCKKCASGYTLFNQTVHSSACPMGTKRYGDYCLGDVHTASTLENATQYCNNIGAIAIPTDSIYKSKFLNSIKLKSIEANEELWNFNTSYLLSGGCGSYPRTDYAHYFNSSGVEKKKLYSVWCDGIHPKNPKTKFSCVFQDCQKSGGCVLPKCKKDIHYKYYEYGCGTIYSIYDKGRTSCSKTDTDLSVRNDTELAKDCNPSNPGLQNCKKTWETCPVDSSKTCAYKGSSYSVFVPLKSFIFDDDSFFKKWEFGKRRGWDCTTVSKNGKELYNCKYGIREIDATSSGKICFTDMQNYKTCIDYSDGSDCSLSGKITSSFESPIKGVIVSEDRKELLPSAISFYKDGFDSSGGGWSNNTITGFGGGIGSVLGRLTGATEKTFDFGVDNAGDTVNISFKMYKIDTWDNEKFETWLNGSRVVNDTYNGQVLGKDDVNLGDFSNETNGGHPYLTKDSYHNYNIHGTLDSNGRITVKFNSTLNQSANDESYAIDDFSISDPSVVSGSTGEIQSNCMLHGKVGFKDIGLGTMSVKSDKNRLIFWNSYNSDMVGFIDMIPKPQTTTLSGSIINFDFLKYSQSTTLDSSISGVSKEVMFFSDKNGSIVNGYADNGLYIGKSDTTKTTIQGGKDLNFNGLHAFSVSLWIKPLEKQSNDVYIMTNTTNQFTIKLLPDGRIKYNLNISGNNTQRISSSKIKIGMWNYITLSFDGTKLSLYLNNSADTSNVSGSIGGSNSDSIIVGSDNSNSHRIEAFVDDISIANAPMFESVHNLRANSNLLLLKDYMSNINEEVKSLMGKGFSIVYKAYNNHVYMVNKEKITSAQCSQKLSGSTFYRAVADADLNINSAYSRKNSVVVDSLISHDCENSGLKECLTHPSSEECNSTKILNDYNASVDNQLVINLASEIYRACDEKRLIRGLSLESQNYKYENAGDKQYCIIESTDTKPVDFYNIKFIKKSVVNTSNHINTYVCSTLDCNTNHVCGKAVCPKDTNGSIGVESGFVGCTANECDFGKPYAPQCGDYSGCSNERDIVKSVLNLQSSIVKNIKVQTGGFIDTTDSQSKRTITVNGSIASTLSRGWNILTFDDNFNPLSAEHYDTYASSANSTLLKNRLNDISKGTMTIIATYDEPSINVSDNASLLESMKNYGITKSIIEHMDYRSAYVFVGRKGDTPLIERYVARNSDGIVESFNFEDMQLKSKCYRISCKNGATYDTNTQTCVKEGCDDKSVLKDGKCISIIAK